MSADSSVDVAAFVLARLADDEQVARAFVNELGEAARWECDEIGGVIRSRGVPFAHLQTHLDAVHIARHDPARVLADVAAKRAIVELTKGMLDEAAEQDRRAELSIYDESGEWQRTDAMMLLRLLAQPWADHEDYDPAWTVTP